MSPLRRRKIPPHNKDIIIVSGLPRSGTSMMMRILEAGGIEPLTDNLRTADQSNPNGYYEFELVKKLPEGNNDWLAEAPGKSIKIISALLRYLPPSHRYRVIYMERSMTEILDSQRRMLELNDHHDDGISDEIMGAMFSEHNQKAISWMKKQEFITSIFVSYNDTLADPKPTIRKVIEFLGENMDYEAMVSIIDPKLYRNRENNSEGSK